MNKGRRNELKTLKYKRRLKLYGIEKLATKSPKGFYAFRSHGKPCSCSACSQPESKYNRAKEKVKCKNDVNNSK